MVRSKWMMSLAAAVASTGLALGQQSELITIAEPGKPAHKCKVIETYKKPDGTQVYKVKDLETGEVFPVEESKGSELKQTGATESAAPAELTPVASTPVAAQPTPAQSSLVGKVITVSEAGQPPQKASIVQTWKMPDGLRAFQVKTLDSGEMMTIVELGAAAPATPGAPVRAMTTRIFHWGRNNSGPAEAPLPPVMAVQTAAPPTVVRDTQAPPAPVVSEPVQIKPMVRTSVAAPPAPSAPLPMTIPASGNMMSQSTSLPAAPTMTTSQFPTLPPVTTTSNMVEVKPAVEPAQPKDWRSSWGRTDSTPAPSPTPTTKTDDSSSAHGLHLFPSRNSPSSTTQAAAQPADTRKDPLSDPAQYSRDPAEKNAAPISQAMGNQYNGMKLPDVPATAPTRNTITPVSGPPAGVVQMPPAPVSQLPPAPVVGQRTPELFQGASGFGSKSSSDSGSGMTIPAPAVTLAQPRHAPALPSELPQNQAPGTAPAPNEMVNAFSPAGKGGQAPGSNVGGPNAFTPAGGSWTPSGQGQPMQAAQMPVSPIMDGPAYTGVPRSAMPTLPSYSSMQQSMSSRATVPAREGGPVAQASYSQTGSAGTASQPLPVPGVRGGISTMPATAPEAQLPSRGSMSTPQVITMLHDSLYPSQREWAADQLAILEWKTNQPAVDALLKSAKEDPAASVRAGCVRSLGKMSCNLIPVVTALRSMQADTDPRVQAEVEHALIKLGAQPAK